MKKRQAYAPVLATSALIFYIIRNVISCNLHK